MLPPGVPPAGSTSMPSAPLRRLLRRLRQAAQPDIAKAIDGEDRAAACLQAAAKGDVKTLKRLLSTGVPVNSKVGARVVQSAAFSR